MPSATRPQRPARWFAAACADRLDLQLLDLVAVAVALDARECRCRSRSGCPAPSARSRRRWWPARCGARCAARKTRSCSAARQAREQRQHFRTPADDACAAPRRPRGSRARRAGTPARRRRLRGTVRRRVDDRSIRSRSFALASAVRVVPESCRLHRGLSSNRPVAHLDRIQPARHFDHRRGLSSLPKCRAKRSASIVAEVTITFRSGRRGRISLQVAEQEIDVQAALVRLVDDERVVGVEQRIALRLGEQDAVGHQLDRRARATAGPWKRTL